MNTENIKLNESIFNFKLNENSGFDDRLRNLLYKFAYKIISFNKLNKQSRELTLIKFRVSKQLNINKVKKIFENSKHKLFIIVMICIYSFLRNNLMKVKNRSYRKQNRNLLKILIANYLTQNYSHVHKIKFLGKINYYSKNEIEIIKKILKLNNELYN